MEKSATLRDTVLRFGLLTGMINILFVFLLYLIDYQWLAKWYVGTLALVFSFVMLVIAGVKQRAAQGGFITLGQAWQTIFFTGAVYLVLNFLFGLLLYTVIDPGLADNLVEANMRNTAAMLESFGMDEEQIETTLAQSEEALRNAYGVRNQAISALTGLVAIAVLSLIPAAIIKKQKPLFDSAEAS